MDQIAFEILLVALAEASSAIHLPTVVRMEWDRGALKARASACELADLAALVEAVLEDLVGLELESEGLVDFPPEQFVALEAGGVAGFGEAVRHGFNVAGVDTPVRFGGEFSVNDRG